MHGWLACPSHLGSVSSSLMEPFSLMEPHHVPQKKGRHMLRKLLLIAAIMINAGTTTADAGCRLFQWRRSCPQPARVCRPAATVCPPSMVQIGAVNARPALNPITIEETYTVQVPEQREVIGPDGKRRTVTTMRQEQRTRTRVLQTATDQIEYLKQRLQGLEQGRVTPLEGRVERLEGGSTP